MKLCRYLLSLALHSLCYTLVLLSVECSVLAYASILMTVVAKVFRPPVPWTTCQQLSRLRYLHVLVTLHNVALALAHPKKPCTVNDCVRGVPCSHTCTTRWIVCTRIDYLPTFRSINTKSQVVCPCMEGSDLVHTVLALRLPACRSHQWWPGHVERFPRRSSACSRRVHPMSDKLNPGR